MKISGKDTNYGFEPAIGFARPKAVGVPEHGQSVVAVFEIDRHERHRVVGVGITSSARSGA